MVGALTSIEIREMTVDDITENYVACLERFGKEKYDIPYLKFMYKSFSINPYVETYVAIKNNRVAGIGTLLIEHKLLHNYSVVGHIEDIATIETGVGKPLIKHLITVAEKRNCYKVILNCAKHNIGFYQKCGFQQSGESQMRIDLLK